MRGCSAMVDVGDYVECDDDEKDGDGNGNGDVDGW